MYNGNVSNDEMITKQKLPINILLTAHSFKSNCFGSTSITSSNLWARLHLFMGAAGHF